jgi:hypothetical protein
MNADQEKSETYHGGAEAREEKRFCRRENFLKHGGTEVPEKRIF